MNSYTFVGMTYQQCRYKDQVKKVPVREIHEQSYILLDDVHDYFPDVRSFTCNGAPVPFEVDEHHLRLKPACIRAFTNEIIDCDKPENDQESPSEINDLAHKIREIDHHVRMICSDIEILKKKADSILRQTFELSEFTVPRLFLVFSEKTSRYSAAQWLHLNYRLHFLCECTDDNGPHLAFHEGYEIKQPREFFRKYGPYLRSMLTVLSVTIPACSTIVQEFIPGNFEVLQSISPQDLNLANKLTLGIEQLNEILTEVEQCENMPPTNGDLQYREGVELREIQSYLKKVDANQTLGNLFRSVTTDGGVRWVCHQHYRQCYSERIIKDLSDECQKLGGEIRQDTVVIDQQASSDFSKILDVIRRGLQISCIILKDINIEAEDFEELLSYVSKQTVIRNLKIGNITVLSNPVNIKKRVIVSKLNKTVEANGKLTIEYSFMKPLSEFQSDTIHAITKTNSRLIFRVRSQEDPPALELVGGKEIGFLLSLNNSDEKSDTSYHTAIQSIFQLVPNISKVILHDKVISESIWACFHQFLKRSETLHELTVDCCLTLEKTKELSLSLSDNRTLKTLHLLNVWKRADDSDLSTRRGRWTSFTQNLDSPVLNDTVDFLKSHVGKNFLVKTLSKSISRPSEKQKLDKSLDEELSGSEKIFEMLHKNTALTEFTLICHSVLLPFDLIVQHLLKNKHLQILRLPKCEIQQNINIKLCESYLRNTSIHTLSFELINTNCDAFLERVACAIDDNEKLETLELKGVDSTATFHRKNHILDTKTSLTCSSSQPKSKQSLNMLSHTDDKHHCRSDEEIIPPSLVPIQEDNSKHISIEPFYTLCNHPCLYKQMQEIAQKFKLGKLQVTIRDNVQMTDVLSSMKSNSTVTELRIKKQMLTAKDIQILVEALRNNTTITHLSLNKMNIFISYIRQIFDVLRKDQTLRVLEVEHCVSRFDRVEFVKEVKILEIDNPRLKVVYENG